jgi:hemerythrin superfamily protein
MDILKKLTDDHGKQRGLGAGLVKTEGASDERKRLWAAYRSELTSHAAAEEQTLYATLMALPNGQKEAQHGVAEHKTMEDIIAELDETDMSSPGWLTRFKTLHDKVEHHLAEEENDIFPLARDLLTESELTTMLSEFEQRKENEAA